MYDFVLLDIPFMLNVLWAFEIISFGHIIVSY